MQMQLQRLEIELEEQVNYAHISEKNLEKANLQIGKLTKDVDNFQKKQRTLIFNVEGTVSWGNRLI